MLTTQHIHPHNCLYLWRGWLTGRFDGLIKIISSLVVIYIFQFVFRLRCVCFIFSRSSVLPLRPVTLYWLLLEDGFHRLHTTWHLLLLNSSNSKHIAHHCVPASQFECSETLNTYIKCIGHISNYYIYSFREKQDWTWRDSCCSIWNPQNLNANLAGRRQSA